MNLGITRSKHIYLIIKVHSKDLPAGRQAKKGHKNPFPFLIRPIRVFTPLTYLAGNSRLGDVILPW